MTCCWLFTMSDMGSLCKQLVLAHDIGNPPFGHAGEQAIRDCFSARPAPISAALTPRQQIDLLAYEGNAQGFRLLTVTSIIPMQAACADSGDAGRFL